MGRRSRKKRARRAWLVPIVLPLLRVVGDRIRKARPRRAYRWGIWLGTVFRWTRLTRGTIRRNLVLALGREPSRKEWRRFLHAYYDHMGLSIIEFFRLPTITPENLDRFFPDQADLRRVKEIYDEGKGVVFVAGHTGSWEIAGYVGGVVGIDLRSVTKPSHYSALDDYVWGIREQGGQTVADVKGAMWGLKKQLDRGAAIAIVVDQEARQNRVFVPFLGIPAATPSAPALLHRLTKAPMVVVAVLRTGPFQYAFHLLDEIRHEKTRDRDRDIEVVTTRINQALEVAIQRAPAQWFWSHRRWRRRPHDETEPFKRVSSSRLSLEGL